MAASAKLFRLRRDCSWSVIASASRAFLPPLYDAAAAAAADNPCRPHQPGNPLLPDRPTFGTQLRMDTRRAIRAARDGMDRAHLLQQFVVRGGTGRRQARRPSIVAGG